MKIYKCWCQDRGGAFETGTHISADNPRRAAECFAEIYANFDTDPFVEIDVSVSEDGVAVRQFTVDVEIEPSFIAVQKR